MKRIRRPRRRTIIWTAAGLLACLVGLAAVIGVVRTGASDGGDSAVASYDAGLPAADGTAVQSEAEAAKAAGDASGDVDAGRSAEEASGAGTEETVATLPPVTAPGQHLVRTGQLTLIVGADRLDRSVAQIVTITRSFDGYVLSSAVGTDGRTLPEASDDVVLPPSGGEEPDTTRDGAEPYAFLTVRVPAERFDEALVRFQRLGRVEELTTSTDDVSGQLVDLRARLRHYRAVEERLLSFLDKADTVEAALAVQDRLDRTQMMVEEIEAQIEQIGETVAYSTLSISLSEKERPTVVVAGSGGGIGGAIVGSLALLGEGFRAIAVALAAALPFLAVIAVAGGLVYLLVRWVRRRRDRRSGPSDAGPGISPDGGPAVTQDGSTA